MTSGRVRNPRHETGLIWNPELQLDNKLRRWWLWIPESAS